MQKESEPITGMTGEMGACWEESKGCHGDIQRIRLYVCGYVTNTWLNGCYAQACMPKDT